MKTMGFARRAASMACALGALLATSQAFAQRGTVIDESLSAIGICSLGDSACTGTMLANFTPEYQQVFVYREGIVAFGTPLAATASLAAGPTSFGGGSWFAPGFSDTQYQPFVTTTRDNNGKQLPLISFFAPGETIISEDVDDDPDTDADETQRRSIPVFQLQLIPFDNKPYYDNNNNYTERLQDARIGFGYSAVDRNMPVDLPAGALIGFSTRGVTQSVTNSNGLLIGSSNFSVFLGGQEAFETVVTDVDTGEIISSEYEYRYPAPVSEFRIVRAAVELPTAGMVPEPATWAMLILGFGMVGVAARANRRRPADAIA